MKKKKNHKFLKLLYFVCAIIVLIAGLYYEGGYTNVDEFINDVKNKTAEVYSEIASNEGNEKNEEKQEIVYKNVKGSLEMHIIDVGQR